MLHIPLLTELIATWFCRSEAPPGVESRVYRLAHLHRCHLSDSWQNAVSYCCDTQALLLCCLSADGCSQLPEATMFLDSLLHLQREQWLRSFIRHLFLILPLPSFHFESSCDCISPAWIIQKKSPYFKVFQQANLIPSASSILFAMFHKLCTLLKIKRGTLFLIVIRHSFHHICNAPILCRMLLIQKGSIDLVMT